MIKKLIFFVFLNFIHNNYSATNTAHLAKPILKKFTQVIATVVTGASITGGAVYYNNGDFNQLKKLTVESFNFCKDKVIDFSNACPQVPAAITGFLLLKYSSRLVSTYTLPSALILSMLAAPIYFNTYEEFQKAVINNNPENIIKNCYNGCKNSLINSTNSMIIFFKTENKPQTNNTLENNSSNDKNFNLNATLNDTINFLTSYKYHLLTGITGLTLLIVFIKKVFSPKNSSPWSTLNKS